MPTMLRSGLSQMAGRSALAGRYPAAVVFSLSALSPFIVLSTASLLLQRDLMRDLGTSQFGTQLADGLANACYAFGAVAAADVIQRLSGRRPYLWCEAGFAAGSVTSIARPGR